jgi:enoyl-CoA hydratase/carnithine racemase
MTDVNLNDRVRVTIDGGVAHVCMTRADKRNALDPAMFTALSEAGEALKTTVGLRAVVLSGEGAAFCAGLDFGSFQQMAGGERPPAGDGVGVNAGNITKSGITHLGQQVCWVWQEIPVPVIAAVHGVALGGGCQIALGADMRIVHPDAKMSILEIRWGLVPDMTGSYRLGQLVRPDIAADLTFTGRMVDGTEAVAIGLATRVSDTPLDDALALAHEIAGKSPTAIRNGKKLLASAFAGADPASQFADERRLIGELIGHPNQVEAVMAFFEKRPAVYPEP